MLTYTTTSPSRRDLRNRSRVAVAGAEPTDAFTAARAEALFVSDVSADASLTPEEYRDAIRRALLRHGGVRGCAAEVAAEYGDHPETAAPRMRWARQIVQSVYARRPVPPFTAHVMAPSASWDGLGQLRLAS
jgi:hypothetical protein